METKLTPEMMETMSLKDIFEYRLNENRHEDQLPELRRLWAAMEVERKEAMKAEKIGFWGRLFNFLKPWSSAARDGLDGGQGGEV